MGEVTMTEQEFENLRAEAARLREALEESNCYCSQYPEPGSPVDEKGVCGRCRALTPDDGWLERVKREARAEALREAVVKADGLASAHALAHKRADAAGNEDTMCFTAGLRDGATGVRDAIRRMAEEDDHA